MKIGLKSCSHDRQPRGTDNGREGGGMIFKVTCSMETYIDAENEADAKSKYAALVREDVDETFCTAEPIKNGDTEGYAVQP